jgi:LysM repeat protein
MTIVPVGNLQEQLSLVGFPLMLVDNIFGDKTEAAVRQFQASAGLEPTGVVNGETWRRLFDGEPLPAEFLGTGEESRKEETNSPELYIRIVLSLRRLLLFEDDNLVANYPVAIGKPTTPTPAGEFIILEKQLNPGGVFGTRWMAFTERRHGIHGTNQPDSISYAVSNGCVRMFNEDVEELFDRVVVGTRVLVETGAVVPPGGDYVVQPGDTLYLIALRFDTTVEALMRVNNLTSDLIFPGQILQIAGAVPPSPIQFFTISVSPGDTLFFLAQRYNTTVEAIMRANDLNQDIIYPGQILLIPATGVP